MQTTNVDNTTTALTIVTSKEEQERERLYREYLRQQEDKRNLAQLVHRQEALKPFREWIGVIGLHSPFLQGSRSVVYAESWNQKLPAGPHFAWH